MAALILTVLSVAEAVPLVEALSAVTGLVVFVLVADAETVTLMVQLPDPGIVPAVMVKLLLFTEPIVVPPQLVLALASELIKVEG